MIIKSIYFATAAGSLALALTTPIVEIGGLKSGPNCPNCDFGKAIGTMTAFGLFFFNVSKSLFTTDLYPK
ncbi:hypothetical protein D3C86_2018060 [compost metagenome]